MSVIGISHVQLAMPRGQEAAARAFYGQLLGLPELLKPAAFAARGGCWFALGDGQQLHLGVETPFQPARKAHPCLQVDDVPALRAHLEAQAVTTTSDDLRPNVQRFYCADPFGNRLEFADGEG